MPAAAVKPLQMTERIQSLKQKMLHEPRYVSIEQARIITEVYRCNEGLPVILKRAKALAASLEKIRIRIDEEELIVGNRTAGVRAGVVFPEAGLSWVDKEFETLPVRSQDRFNVHPEDIVEFREHILPYWQGKTLEDYIYGHMGDEIGAISKVVKINQTDHAQGHICPHVEKWLRYGPAGLKAEVEAKREAAKGEKKDFYQAAEIVLSAAQSFMRRYSQLAGEMAGRNAASGNRDTLLEVSRICEKLASHPPETFWEALQSVWFLFVILQMESNASSFSPGRMDQYLYPYLEKDLREGRLNLPRALELVGALWLKFNQIVYLRSANSAKYFAGFPIGFNVAVGGQTVGGEDATNLLSYLFLKAQDHIRLPQPNLSVRLHRRVPDDFLNECSRVIGLGGGMPQIFNDESIIPALENQGIAREDAMNYAIVGCVELTTQGNNLGWSDAAMFNLVKVLELTLNNGKCFLTGQQIGLPTGDLTTYSSYHDLEQAFAKQVDYFIEKMIRCCEFVDQAHAGVLPSPFLSTVIDDCLDKAQDVTAGGAHYNLSGIQVIQVANIADSLAALQQAVYKDQTISPEDLLEALRENYAGNEKMSQYLLNKIPKYGNDVEWVDEIAHKWVKYFTDHLKAYTNARGGPYHTGLYTVSAHVPMGQNVGATPDGRKSREPLADGGMSAVYGRDRLGPTALLKSVSRVNSMLGSNGTLLNMKFLPELFQTREGVRKFSGFLKTFVRLHINHVQFNVIRKEDLIAAKKEPEKYRGLVVRVAGYTAYFTELAGDLQDEIIARTAYGGL